MPEAGITWFAIYHPNYKDKLVGNPTWKFVSIANRLYFLYSWSNLWAAFFFTYDSGICIAELDIVIKKQEPPKTSLRRSWLFLLPSLSLLGLTLSKMRPAIFEYLAIFKYTLMSKWQSENLLKVTSNPFLAAQIAAQTVKSFSDNNALSNKQLQWQITVIGSTQWTTRLNRGGEAQRERKKLPHGSKNWCRAENGGKVFH